jgi:hypothetical protein
MGRFKIRDLMASVEPARRAAQEHRQRHHNLAQADVPCETTIGPLGCPHSYDRPLGGGCPHSYDIVAVGQSPGALIEQASKEELSALKVQLIALLAKVESRESELGSGGQPQAP